MPELRWNSLLGQWVATASRHSLRTFLPSGDFCPLCPSGDGAVATEIPHADYEIAVMENRFPALRMPAPEPSLESHGLFSVAPALGASEVVLYTSRHDATFADLDRSTIRNLIEVWADRYKELGDRPEIAYVFICENRSEETLHHPHGQIYGYPFIPPVVLKELEQFARYDDEHAACLLCDLREDELHEGKRIVIADEMFAAYVPFAARWPYEVHIVTARHIGAVTDFSDAERESFAEMLSRITRAYDRLFGRPFPYAMAMHSCPTDAPHHGYHFHLEFYPLLRDDDRLKYLAGSELGAGMFINDTLPEETAARLREALP